MPRNSASFRFGGLGVAALLVVLAALFLAGCTKVLDTDKAETEIKKGIQQQTWGTETVSVSCPDDVHIKAKATFQCTATAEDGAKTQVKVTQTDDKGNIQWEELHSAAHVGSVDD